MPTIQDSRILIKTSTVSGTVPTIPASNDHTDGTWLITDIYKGELFINIADQKIYSRSTAGIFEIKENNFKGTYASLSALTTAWPSAVSGNTAIVDAGVGSPAQLAIWDNDDNIWRLVSGSGGIVLTDLSATSPLSYNSTTGVFSIQVANTSQAGYLSASDWNVFNGKQDKSIVISANQTAVNDGAYTVVAPATFTDPSPVEGKGFTVIVRNGTATVGGTAYAVAGTVIRRIFHSGAWANYANVLTSPTPVNTPIATGMNPQQTAEALQGQENDRIEYTKNQVFNKQYMNDFYSAIYNQLRVDSTQQIGIAWTGDSVSNHVSGAIISSLSNYFPLAFSSLPASYQQSLNQVYIGNFKYRGDQSKRSNQSLLITPNGQVSGCTITRSGSTATITFPRQQDFSVGNPITVSGATQSEYNGTFAVDSVVTPGFVYTYTVSGTPATPATGTIVGYGGEYDFTYLPNAQQTEFMDGATLTLNAGESQYDKWLSVFATGPDMGSVQIDLIEYYTAAVISTITLNLSNPTLGATHHFSTGGTNLTSYRLKYTAIGKVVQLQTMFLINTGIVPVNLGLGGSTFTQNCYSSNTIFTYLCNVLNVRLICVQAKEEGLPDSLVPLASRLNLLTTASKLIINSLPDSGIGADAGIRASGIMYKKMAIQNKYAFFDGFEMFGSYAELLRLGWQGDGVHPSSQGNEVCALTILNDIYSIPDIFNNVLIKNIDQRYSPSSVRSILKKLSIRTSNANRYTDVIVEHGSTARDLVVIQNVSGVWFGNPSTSTTTRIAPYDLNAVQFLRQNNTLTGIRAESAVLTGNGGAAVSWGVGGGAAAIPAQKNLHVHASDTGTTNTLTNTRLSRYSTNVVAAGFGTGYDTALENDSGTGIIASQDITIWSSAVNTAESSAKDFWLMFSGVLRKSITFLSNGGISLLIAGARLTYKTGTNQAVGSATLVAGAVTVANTTVTANTKVMVQLLTPAGTMGLRYKYSVSAGVGFTITAVDASGATVTTDTSVVDYYLTELV